MSLSTTTIREGLALAGRVHKKYQPVWEGREPSEAAALGLYFLPHRSTKLELAPTRPRMIKWYCPFADQAEFPTGHRYCINVFTGCEHNCEYCYAKAYEPGHASCKKDFARAFHRDLEELEAYEVPAAPVHLSNSTDPFQRLEAESGQTRFALEQILRSQPLGRAAEPHDQGRGFELHWTCCHRGRKGRAPGEVEVAATITPAKGTPTTATLKFRVAGKGD
jgi:hypothetical protein